MKTHEAKAGTQVGASKKRTGMTRANARTGKSLALQDLAERFWVFRCFEEPYGAIQAGQKDVGTKLFRDASDDFDRRFNSAGVFLSELEGIGEGDLGSQDWATHSLIRRELEDIRSFYKLKAHQRPSLFPLGPEFQTVDFANTASLRTTEEAQLYVERLKSVPSYFGDVIANLSEGRAAGIRYPRQVIASASAVANSYIQGRIEDLAWFAPFRRSALTGPGINRTSKDAQGVIASELVPAVRRYVDFLTESLAQVARDSVSCAGDPEGDEFYRTLIRHFTTTDLTAAQLYELGEAEVHRLTAAMRSVASDAGFRGDLGEYRAYLKGNRQFFAPSKDALRGQFESLSKRIDLKIPMFFGRTPRATYGVQTIPEATAAMLPRAYAQPNPADCSAPGVYWVTSIPDKAPTYIQIPLALHEGWPGHLMHMALIQENTELPAFRRFGATFGGGWRYSVCLEGWAVYCEGLGVEMGLYETPHQEYGRLEMEMQRALRLVIDTGCHAQGWSRAQAIHYMSTHIASAPSAIESAVDRYIGLPGQALAYQVGNLKFRELRTRAERRLARRFDLRTYHDQLMAVGPVTLPVLDRVVDNYLDRAGT